MMAAVSLLKGACTLREEDTFLDYTIEVEDEQFKVHKLVMASVSDYFKAMLTGGMVESQTDRVRLEGQSSLVVEDMIKFIYTGQFSLSKVTREELLACAMFLQIPAAIEECTRLLLNQKDDKNWFGVLQTFKTFGCKDGIDRTLDYIRTHLDNIVRVSGTDEISYDELLFLVDDWQNSEWNLFHVIKQWIRKDIENRKQHIDDLMGHVRFALMTPEQVRVMKHPKMLPDLEGSWRDLLVEAEKYHSLPTHVKVLDESAQSRVRGPQTPIFYDFNENYTSELYCLNNGKSWKRHKVKCAPSFYNGVSACLAVNNYLIVSGYYDPATSRHRGWFIFDPRTLTWSIMANLKIPRGSFAAVYHDKHLYVLGGQTDPEDSKNDKGSPTDVIEKYDFACNTWEIISTKLPIALHSIGAAVIDSCIYVVGGYTHGEWKSDGRRFSCLDLSTDTWHNKAPMPEYFDTRQRVFVMKLWGEEVLFLMDQEFAMHYYSPVADQWSKWHCLSDVVSDIIHSERPEVLVDQNTMFVYGFCYDLKEYRTDQHLHPDDRSRGCVGCVKWTVGEKGEEISEVRLQNLPVCTLMSMYSGNFTVLLSINPQD